MDIQLPYELETELWIVRKVLYISGHEKLYIRKETNYEEYQDKPIYNEKWIKENLFLHKYTFDEDGWSFKFSGNKWTTDNEEMIWLYESEIYIFKNEDEADNKLKELNS